MEKNSLKKCIDKIYGGLNMSWLTVVLYAVFTAVLTALFLLVPAFKGTSFERVGVHLEAWIFFAVILMANCKTPLESALKTFVFFLISQPLIYLFQVPFNVHGWGIFVYYRTWFLWTLATFPMAYIGWYITKRNWLSVLILAPVLAFLGYTAYSVFLDLPRLLLTVLFCIFQIVLYIVAFFPNVKAALLGILIPAAVVAFFLLRGPSINVSADALLPDTYTFSDQAVLVQEESPVGTVTLRSSDIVRIEAKDYGSIDFSIQDGGKEYPFTARVYRDESGHTQIEITER